MIDPLSDIALFARVVESGSFTAAAAELQISTSYASRRVRVLEDRLGARLLHRTTRQLALTDAGRAFYEQAAPHLEGLLDAERAVSALQSEPRGTLRIAAPLSFGLRWLQPALLPFLQRWPELRVEISFDDRTRDIVGEGFDLAIRGGRLADTSLVARRLCSFRGLLVASPAYLAARGRPSHPHQLAEHTLLDYAVTTSMPRWWFQGPEGELSVEGRGHLVADSGEALVAWARAGLGIAYQPEFLLADLLASGELEALLPDWQTWEGAFHAVYPHRRHLSPKVRLLVEHLAQALAGPPWA
jgi:DNA-binding transcriptional LysR family regulator